MESFFQDIVSFTTSFDLWTVLALLFWVFIGEVGITVPYVLESFWLLIGYNIGAGILNPGYLIVLWLTAQAGRQAGSLGLYRIALFGMPALGRFFHKVHLDRLFEKIKNKTSKAGKINLLTPFSVAFGRMFAMRIPMVVACASKKKWRTLMGGVLISSVIWDTLYISMGAAFGATVDIGQGYMLLISLGSMTVIFLLTRLVKKAVLWIKNRPAARPKPATTRVFSRALWALKMSTLLIVFPVSVFNRIGEKFR